MNVQTNGTEYKLGRDLRSGGHSDIRSKVDPELLRDALIYQAEFGAGGTTDPLERRRRYENSLPKPRELEGHYFPEGVVAFTDARDNIAVLPVEKLPYASRPAVVRHEEIHCEIQRAGGIHNEAAINRQVVNEFRLYRFPFGSYHDPLHY